MDVLSFALLRLPVARRFAARQRTLDLLTESEELWLCGIKLLLLIDWKIGGRPGRRCRPSEMNVRKCQSEPFVLDLDFHCEWEGPVGLGEAFHTFARVLDDPITDQDAFGWVIILDHSLG